MKAMILAAGIGSRLRPFTDSMPKAMVPVAGKPVVLHIIERLAEQGVNDFIVNLHHFADKLQEYLLNSVPDNISLSFSDERDQLLDTGGALKKAGDFFSDEEFFLIHNADVWTTLDTRAITESHQNSGVVATLAVRKRDSSRSFVFDSSLHLCGWEDARAKKRIVVREVAGTVLNLAFSGVQVVSPAIFKYFPEHDCFPLAELYLKAARAGETVSGFVHDRDEWYDLGTPEKVEHLNRTLCGSV